MIRILICDDEGIVQESLKFMIKKSFGDTCEIESAKNGRKAIELAESFGPDIIFMDIQMPGINGIEAMKEIRREKKNIIFIVLTAYDKFEYTQKSIDIGVMSYLTKPLNRDTLTEVLGKAIRETKERKEKAKNDLEVKEKLEVVVPMIENGFIYNAILGGIRGGGVGYQELLDIQTDYGYAMIIECGDEIRKGVLTNTVGAGIRMQKHYMVMREMVKESTGGLVGGLIGNKVIVFVPCESGEEEYEQRVLKIEQIRGMVRKMERQFEAKFKVGIGSVKKWKEIGDSYQEAFDTGCHGEGKVNHVEDLSMTLTYEEGYPYEMEKELFAAVESGGYEKAERLSEQFVSWMRSSSEEISNSVRLKVLEFILRAEQIAYMQGGSVYHFASREGYLDTVLMFRDYEELGLWFVKKMKEISKHIATKQQEKTENIIDKVKEYIAEGFSGDISLEKMAKEVGISPYYLSKLFKESEGVTYIDYVIALRMDYAKKQLSHSSKSIKEICHESGYSDPNYFSRIFKKWTGQTPTEFRSGGV